jgi:uncharacterized membrane protein YraQ (UPF0718 family)
MADYALALTAALQAGFTTLLGYLSAHVLTCLIPAFFIAGAIAALLQKETVLKYFGRDAPKWLCYSVAATSGTILAVCSCTILPMFAGIERKGAGIGPATAFLFSGPAINLLAIVLTARVLGLDLGIARAIAAVSMAVVIGIVMAAIFERSPQKCEVEPGNDTAMTAKPIQTAEDPAEPGGPQHKSILLLALLIGVLLSATSSLQFAMKWTIVAAFILASAFVLRGYFSDDERSAFFGETWDLARKIFPLLIVGTFITGVIGYFLPVDLIRVIFGSNSFLACFVASIVGALLYMPTLLEVPVVGTLFGYSTGVTAPGPALALLLSGPSLSLPSMIVIMRVIGPKKGGVYIGLVVLISTLVGMLYGSIVG